MAAFLKTWGSLIIASLALAQPWVIALWKRLFRQGDLELFHSSSADLGYSTLGATLGVMGTLRAVHKDQFVYKMKITIKRLKDGAQHVLDWAAFRPARLTLGPPADSSIEVVSAFMIPTTAPFRFNLLFIDNGLLREFEPHLISVRDRWNSLTLSSLAGASSESMQKLVDATYQEFAVTHEVKDTITAIDRLFYWTSGEYEIDLQVLTTELEITDTFTFQITDANSTLLRLNSSRIVDAACNRPNVQFSFAYVELQAGPSAK